MVTGDSKRYPDPLAMLFKLMSPEKPNWTGADTKSSIINLSHYFKPDQHQIELLEKGLSFIPTLDIYKKQTNNLNKDLSDYHRRLKLAAHFGTERDQDYLPFLPKSNWEPKKTDIQPELRQLIRQDIQTISHIPGHVKEKHNLTKEQVKALRTLADNNQIIVKPADKGSSIVILDRYQYLLEGERQLNNQEHYKPLPGPIYQDTAIRVKEIIARLRQGKHITYKQEQHLLGKEAPRPRVFYLLPKCHKPPETWTIPHELPPGRPIVSDCGSETYMTAAFIEYYLNPLSVRHASYIKDTYHFVDTIKAITVPKEAILFSIDIDSLYTNIETRAGLEAVKIMFDKYPDSSRPEEELLELLEINLTRNDFEFNNKYYLQIKGTAMGKRFAPSYANIYMALWEETALAKCNLKPTHYFRFLDDIFGIWPHSEEDFLEFIGVLNSHHRSIKLKYTTSKESIDFLDVSVYKGNQFETNQKLDLKVYFKDTDTHALLHKSSFHPTHCFSGIVKSQLLRFKRICTQEGDFQTACKILFKALRGRGYTRTFLRRAQRTFLDVKARDDRPKIALITDYSTRSKMANSRIKRNFENRGTGLLEEVKIISAYRRNKNLRDYLVHSKLKQTDQPTRRKPDYFQAKQTVKNRTTKAVYGIPQKIQANTKNCVYLITCQTCGLQYVGETRNTIADRLNQHRYYINNGKKSSVIIQHFRIHGIQAMSVAGLQHDENWTEGQRRFAERQWISKLDTSFPNGLNMS